MAMVIITVLVTMLVGIEMDKNHRIDCLGLQ